MRREARDNRPRLPPVEKVELSEKHKKLRWAAAIVFLIIGAAALGYGVSLLVTPESGWTEIQVSSMVDSCAGDFVLMYNLGASGNSPRGEKNALTALYTDTMAKAWKLFHPTQTYAGVNNLAAVNQNPNQAVTVEPALYQALALVEQYGERRVYLGPLYETYNGLFSCREDSFAAEYDPYANPMLRDFHGEVAAFAADPKAVSLELLGEDQVCLHVSQAYLEYAEEYEFTAFIDFAWMKNAFIADYAAQALSDGGYTWGALSSKDGFMRNLDASGEAFRLNLFDLSGQTIYPAGQMVYVGPMALVYLRDYPLTAADSDRFYAWSDGQIRSKYLDMADGLCRSATHDLVAYSPQDGCAEIVLQIAPYYVAEALDEKALTTLPQVQTLYCKGRVLYHTDASLILENLYDQDGVAYTAKLVK